MLHQIPLSEASMDGLQGLLSRSLETAARQSLSALRVLPEITAEQVRDAFAKGYGLPISSRSR
jgi:hypothetical protein